jgi:hypothetical protein
MDGVDHENYMYKSAKIPEKSKDQRFSVRLRPSSLKEEKK